MRSRSPGRPPATFSNVSTLLPRPDGRLTTPYDEERQLGATRLGHYACARRHKTHHPGALSLLSLIAGNPEGSWNVIRRSLAARGDRMYNHANSDAAVWCSLDLRPPHRSGCPPLTAASAVIQARRDSSPRAQTMGDWPDSVGAASRKNRRFISRMVADPRQPPNLTQPWSHARPKREWCDYPMSSPK
jgi:hypothetical protein